LGIADLRQSLEKFGKHPQQKCGVDLRRPDQLVRNHDIHDPSSAVSLKKILDVEHRLAKELVPALLLDFCERALYRANRRGGNVSVLGPEFLCAIADRLQHRTQVFQIQQQQSGIVRDLEHKREYALLGGIQVEQPTEQQR